MGLSNALFCGLSGLDVNQVKLNVVANNIANVNTVAFKSSRVLFKPQFYITDSGGSQPTGDSGGTNPSQRGLGAVVAIIDRNLSPGTIETTGRSTDLAIDGEGYFIVRSDETKYTRDGSFSLNQDKYLVTSSGDFVQGYAVDNDYNIVPGQLTNLVIPIGSLTTAEATTSATITGNLNKSGPVASGASILTSQLLTVVGGGSAPDGSTLLTNVASTSDPNTPRFAVGDQLTLSARKGSSGTSLDPATFTVTATSTLDDLMEFFQQTLGINTTVPDDSNPDTPTPGVTLEVDPTDPNSARIVVVGNLGLENTISIPVGSFCTTGGQSPLAFSEGSNNAGNVDGPVGESARAMAIAYDSLGSPVRITVTAVLESRATSGNTWRFFVESPDAADGNRAIGTGTLLFDNLGRLLEADGTSISISREGTGAVTPLTLDLNFSLMTSLDGDRSEMRMNSDDGSAIGTLTAFTIGEDGMIAGSFSNGVTRTLGQVAVATFDNPNGLIDRGGNMFSEGANSGAAIITTPNTLGAGKIVAGSLEISNVDLSEEFINLIIASTGFAAASRVISTSDQLIQELLNASR